MPVFNIGSNSDLQSVATIKDLFNDHFGIDLKETTQFHLFDLKDKENKVIVEVKRRGVPLKAYPTYIMNKNKIEKGKEYIKRGYKVYFVIEYSDGIFYHNYTGETYKKVDIPRFDRGSTAECVAIPISHLTRFCDVEYDF